MRSWSSAAEAVTAESSTRLEALAWLAAVTRQESLLCELNCGLTGMARQFSELSVIPKGVAALPNSRS
jgi:hypothetical protein